MSSKSVPVLLYSEDASRRKAVIDGIGERPGKGMPAVQWIECATEAGAVAKYQESAPRILVLDAESTKVGGMAVAKRLENELDANEPIVLLTARPQDAWLAAWAGAAQVVSDPLDPVDLQEALSAAIRALK